MMDTSIDLRDSGSWKPAVRTHALVLETNERVVITPPHGLAAGEMITVGRSPSVDYCTNDPLASRRHFLVECTSTGALLTDLGSCNGTYVNGQKVERIFLASGDVIVAGSTVYNVRFAPV